MTNLTHVIAITISQGQIQPCIRINRGIYVASTEQGAKFMIALSFTYTSGGVEAGPVTATQAVTSTRFRQLLDERNVRAQGAQIPLRSLPDTGTPVVCVAKVVITDATGTVIECGDADTASFTAP